MLVVECDLMIFNDNIQSWSNACLNASRVLPCKKTTMNAVIEKTRHVHMCREYL